MIFQCLGITGAILLFYGMVAFAITQALTWQNKLLLIAGLVMMIVFLIEAVRKSWLKDLFKKEKHNTEWRRSFIQPLSLLF